MDGLLVFFFPFFSWLLFLAHETTNQIMKVLPGALVTKLWSSARRIEIKIGSVQATVAILVLALLMIVLEPLWMEYSILFIDSMMASLDDFLEWTMQYLP